MKEIQDVTEAEIQRIAQVKIFISAPYRTRIEPSGDPLENVLDYFNFDHTVCRIVWNLE